MNMKTHRFLFSKNFILCGLAGWCMEILFTAVKNVHHIDRRLIGQTSVWMFPIYGCAALIKPMYRFVGRLPLPVRGSIYSAVILTGEFISGSLLKKHGCCPWDYSHARFNICGIIRLDYAPLWMGVGLLFEQILGCHHSTGTTSALSHADHLYTFPTRLHRQSRHLNISCKYIEMNSLLSKY